MLFGALALATSTSFVGCKDYDDDIDHLQEQVDANKSAIAEVEAAMKAGKFIVSYTAVTNGYELTLSDGSKLNITNGKDGEKGEKGEQGLNGNPIIPKFKVSSDNYWMVSTDDGVNYEYVLDQEGNKVNATGKQGEPGEPGKPGEPGQDASANVTINADGYIVIGDTQTSLKYDATIPSIVINEVDGLYVIKLNGKEYKMLAEGSAYNGLQSVTFRRQSPDNSGNYYVESIKLMSSWANDAELLATSASIATFKVWPKTMDLNKATFEFTDTYKTRAVTPTLKYVSGSAKWIDGKEGILSVNLTPENIESNKIYASSLDITINGHTTASDYFEFYAQVWTPGDLNFIHTADSVTVPVSELANMTPTIWIDRYYPEYTFIYNKTYNLNDSVALGNGIKEKFRSLPDIGFSGINVKFTQTSGKAKGIFEIKDGVVSVKASEQASAINEVCYVTATYLNADNKEIASYDFAVKAVREQSVAPALVDIDVETKDAAEAAKLAALEYSTSDQSIDMNVRAFLSSLGGRDYMSNNSNTSTIQHYGLYYLTQENGKTYANKVGAYLQYTPGQTTDKDKLQLIIPATTIIQGAQELYSYSNWPVSGDKYEITSNETYTWRKSSTILAVNGSRKQFTLKLKDLVKCERKVIIKQNSAFVVDGSTTIIGAWDETNHTFAMTANLEDLYAVYKSDGATKSNEQVTYTLVERSKQSAKVQAIYNNISISNNVITVSPVVDVKNLGGIKIEANITGTNIKATILNNGVEGYCEPVLRSPLAAMTYKSSVNWTIDGDANKTFNVGTKAGIKMLDKDINVTNKNVVIENGQIKTPWSTAYGITANKVKFVITGYSETVNEGTFTIDAQSGVITCNNTNIALSLDIYVKVTVSHNWGADTIEKITVKASL